MTAFAPFNAERNRVAVALVTAVRWLIVSPMSEAARPTRPAAKGTATRAVFMSQRISFTASLVSQAGPLESSVIRITVQSMAERLGTDQTTSQEAAEDLAELTFAPLPPEEAAELDDRVYLLGVRREYHNIR